MPNDFLSLSFGERREILEAITGSWHPGVLEKDVWVVWCLKALFTQPDAPGYAFKGGTSLSKAYDAINRFSEDVDITVSTKHTLILGADVDILDTSLSNRQRDRLNEQAAEKLAHYLREALVPHLESVAAELPKEHRPTFSADGEDVHVAYPSALPSEGQPSYLQHKVLLEFGTRGTTEPSEEHPIITYLEATNVTEGLAFPKAHAMVMRAERTFWEKATLIHAELTRTKTKYRPRYARHWYDLYQLSTNSSIGPAALAARDMLEQVISIKSKQFRGGGVKYEECSNGGLRLIPQGELLQHLKADYSQMLDAGMFLTDPPSFIDILEHLRDLEETIND